MKTAAIIIISGLFLACSPKAETERAASKTEKAVSKENGKVENLTAGEMASRMEQHPGLILDVRTPKETADGAVEGALMSDFYASGFADSIKALPKNQPVYVYCASGGRSSEAAKIMIDQGFSEVYNLVGGMGAWKLQGLPTSK